MPPKKQTLDYDEKETILSPHVDSTNQPDGKDQLKKIYTDLKLNNTTSKQTIEEPKTPASLV